MGEGAGSQYDKCEGVRVISRRVLSSKRRRRAGRTYQRNNRTNLPNHHTHSHRLPPSGIRKCEQRSPRINMRRQHAQYNQHSHKTRDMQKHEEILYPWQLTPSEDITEHANQRHGYDEKRALVAGEGVVGVAQTHEGLDHCGGKEEAGGVVGLPGEDG